MYVFKKEEISKEKKVKYGIVGILVLLMTMGTLFVTPLTLGEQMYRLDSLTKPLIVKIGEDAAVNTAVSTLQKYLGSFRMVQIGSERELQTVLGSHVAIFIVGHGNSEGLGGTPMQVVLTWNSIKTFLQAYSKAKAYVIACDAQTSLENVNIKAFGTTGKIDAEIGALQALAKFYLDFNNKNDFIGVLSDLVSIFLFKPITSYKYLGIEGDEPKWIFINGVGLLLATFLTASAAIAKNYLISALYALASGFANYLPSLISILTLINNLINGQLPSIDTLVSAILGTLTLFVSIVSHWVRLIPWWELWKVAVIKGEEATKLNPSPASIALTITAAVVLFLNYAWIILKIIDDIGDNDGKSRIAWVAF